MNQPTETNVAHREIAPPAQPIVTMPFAPHYDSDGITIYHGDCRKILPWLDRVDLLLTDPPYGIAYKASRYRNARHEGAIAGDDVPFNPWQLMEVDAEHKVVWGGSNFADRMPRGGWLVWDKRCNERIWFSPACEQEKGLLF